MQINGLGPLVRPPDFSHQSRTEQNTRTNDSSSKPPTSSDQTTSPTQSEPAQSNSKPTNPGQLSEEEQKQLRELQKRDSEVRAHEAAHKTVAGQYAHGAVNFSYQKGPDGRLYATGGEVGIDTSPIDGDPEATLQKANQIRAAALAPAQPSSQDFAVAAAAAAMAAEARAEIATAQFEKQRTDTPNTEEQDITLAPDTQNNSRETDQYTAIANGRTDNTNSVINLLA